MSNAHPKTKERLEQEKELLSKFLKLDNKQQAFMLKLMYALLSENIHWLKDLRKECPPEGLEPLENLITLQEAKP